MHPTGVNHMDVVASVKPICYNSWSDNSCWPLTLKILFLILLITFSLTTSALEGPFTLSDKVHHNSKQTFKPHHGEGRFGSYLTMAVNFAPIKKLFEQFSAHYTEQHSINLKSRGEAHITVITPPEYHDILKSKLTMAEIDAIALGSNIQSANFDVVCLGKGNAMIKNKPQVAFYVVVNAVELLNIRQKIQALYIKKGGNVDDFQAEQFYPHITLGFSSRDLHESDGVIKGAQSCYADLVNH